MELLSGMPGKRGGKGRSARAETEVEGGGGFSGEQEGEFGGGGGRLEEETWRAVGCCGAASTGKHNFGKYLQIPQTPIDLSTPCSSY